MAERNIGHTVLIVRKLPHAEGLELPRYETKGASGLDLRAAIPANEEWTLQPGQRKLVPTGLVIELHPGTEGQVRSRSGLASDYGVFVLNAPGTIDSDYRGEVQVLLANAGERGFRIERGMRIAQLVIARYIAVDPLHVEQGEQRVRGSSGFGSTGSS